MYLTIQLLKGLLSSEVGLLQCYLSEPLLYLISGHLLCRASDVFADREAGVGESCASSRKASDVKDQPGGRDVAESTTSHDGETPGS